MKYITSIIVICAVLIGSMHVTSCSTFTKSDAQSLGVQIATQSLAVAAQVVAGQPVDLKKEIAAIGLQAASSAVTTVTYNLATNATATPQSLVTDSHAQAQAAIANATVQNPAVASQAAAIATQAVAAAQAQIASANAAVPAPSN